MVPVRDWKENLSMVYLHFFSRILSIDLTVYHLMWSRTKNLREQFGTEKLWYWYGRNVQILQVINSSYISCSKDLLSLDWVSDNTDLMRHRWCSQRGRVKCCCSKTFCCFVTSCGKVQLQQESAASAKKAEKASVGVTKEQIHRNFWSSTVYQ